MSCETPSGTLGALPQTPRGETEASLVIGYDSLADWQACVTPVKRWLHPTTCRKCQQTSLFWLLKGGKWKIVDKHNRPHKCRKKSLKEHHS